MPTTPTPGSDRPLEERATYGGAGLEVRRKSHARDVREGRAWHTCGSRSEVAPLREVMLAWPGKELCFDGPPDEQLFLEHVDLTDLRSETSALCDAYESLGVKVHKVRPAAPPPPNFIFMRDLFLMTPEGAVLARTAPVQRAGEERHMAAGLAALGVPILLTLRGQATFEGADALWMDEKTLLVGLGRRTNVEALRQMGPLLADLGVRVAGIELAGAVQHLLGVVNFVDRDLAVVFRERAPRELFLILEARGVRTIALETTTEVTHRRSMNFVTVAPRCIVMPADCPQTRAIYEAEGIECFEVPVDEYLKAAGGPGCLTGIIRRGEG